MKKILLIALTLLLSFNSFSQSPQGFNYQAIVRDANGNIRSNQGVQFTFEIIDGTGNSVYTEFHTVVTNKYGLVDDIIIGNGASSDNFSNINSYLRIDVCNSFPGIGGNKGLICISHQPSRRASRPELYGGSSVFPE